MAKRLSEIRPKEYLGCNITVTFIAREVFIGKQNNSSSEFMKIKMGDLDTNESATIFDVSEDVKKLVTVGNVYDAIINVKPYDKGKDGVSCIILNSDIQPSSADPDIFTRWVDDFNKYREELSKWTAFIDNTVYGRIAVELIREKYNNYCRWVAAKSMHHTELGALLMHSITVARLCYGVYNTYSNIYGDDFINIKLLISASLIHDIGKIDELTITNGVVDYSVESSLLTHINIVDSCIIKKAMELGYDINSEEVTLLRHLILSHHGELEYGSPIKPHVIEADILSRMDSLDATSWRYKKSYTELESGKCEAKWKPDGLEVVYKDTTKR